MQRIKHMLNARDADLIWIEKEALPWMPWVFEHALLPKGVPYVVDYDDSVFHRYDLHQNPIIRFGLGTKLRRIMAGAACVTVGNEYLAEYAHCAGARRVEYVPTVVDIERYTVRLPNTGEGPVRIGWIGTPKTWKSSAEPVFEILRSVLIERGAKFHAVGAHLLSVETGNLEVVPWKEETEVAEIQTFDIGIMPLHDDPWTRGKCGYKLIQYMACGLPVVASPIGVNKTIVQNGINGFLVETPAEWRSAISTLIDNPDLRRTMGAAGRKLVQSQYTLQTWSTNVLNILSESRALHTGAEDLHVGRSHG